MLGYGPEDKSAVLELTYNYGVTEYDKGNAYAQVHHLRVSWKMYASLSIQLTWIVIWPWLVKQIAIGTDDVYKTAEAIQLCGGKITREPGPLPGINTKITACLDPDGWKTVLVFVWILLHFNPCTLETNQVCFGSRDGPVLFLCKRRIGVIWSNKSHWHFILILLILQVFVDNIDFQKELEWILL